ncbi:MAG: type VI secretion system lipoprotein TssJ [Desulfobacteraceae bacterium]
MNPSSGKKLLIVTRSLKIIVSVFVFFAVALCGSCGGKKAGQAGPEPDWSFQPKGIEISYRADRMLNEYQGESHAIQVVVYQLDNLNRFRELAEYKDGLIRLLKAKSFDPSVKAVKKMFVDPGESGKLVLDRAENSKWVGIVAGYFDLVPGRSSCFFEIPDKVEKKGIVFKKEVPVVMKLKAEILLKNNELKKIE